MTWPRGATGEETFIWLTYLSDDGVAVDIAYAFPVDQADLGMELALYSFGTLIVN